MVNGVIREQYEKVKGMKLMSVSDNNGDKSESQHLPQIEYVACPHATQYLYINQAIRTHLNVASNFQCIITKSTC